MVNFQYKNDGEMYCEDVPLSSLTEKFGTPLYVYSSSSLKQNYLDLYEAYKEINPLICFSVKANSNIHILKKLVDLGSGLDIVSEGELYRALKAGCPPEKIVFAGVGKKTSEIEKALESNIKMFNVESYPELARINDIAKRMNTKAPVCLRVNPDVDPKTHRYITTGKKENKFGLDFELAIDIFKKSRTMDHIDLQGIHCHVGSQITEVSPFFKALEAVKGFLEQLASEGFEIPVFNFGGGIGITYKDERPQKPKEIAKQLLPCLKNLNVKEFIFEPGRYIAGNSGVLVTQVQYIKKSPPKTFVIVDSAMNDLLRPSLYQAYHHVVALKKHSQKLKADIVGPICESADAFTVEREIDLVEQNDHVVILSAGAYAFSMASNYNTRPRAAEVLVDGENYELIRRRETYEDLIAQEIIS
ncbi:diaminopimelate decarboxylase [PVC group bacterium (ex Bugula neritina AB1)]|nr:diaminopimelate decarboxylase [PVC group bacterium (ex Bugula neritina AB1)]